MSETGKCGKASFPSRRSARAAATTIAKQNGDRRMRAYFHHDCRAWHLSSEATRTY